MKKRKEESSGKKKADGKPTPEEIQESSQASSEEIVEEAGAQEGMKTLQEKAKERDEFLEKLKRARADYANYQKRVEREKETLSKYIMQEFLLSLLPVLDNLQRAIESSKKSNDFDKFLEGVNMVERQFLKVLEDGGVKRINAEGETFDPAFHEAAFQMENEEVPANTVLEEIEKGYVFHDRVLRASKVIVSKKKDNEAGAEEEKADEEDTVEEEMGSSPGPSSANRE